MGKDDGASSGTEHTVMKAQFYVVNRENSKLHAKLSEATKIIQAWANSADDSPLRQRSLKFVKENK